MSGLLGKLATRLRKQGLGGTLAKFWRDHIFRITQSVIVEYREGWRKVTAVRSLPDGLSMVIVEGNDPIPPLCDWLAWRRTGFESMLAQGKTGLLMLLDDKVVGCVWLSFSDHRDAKAHEFYAVPPGEAYHYCWLVDPDCRNSQIGLILCRQTMSYLASRGITRQFGIVDLTNDASYLIQIFFGYRECGTKVTHYYILGTQWTRISAYTGLLGPQRRSRQQVAHAA